MIALGNTEWGALMVWVSITIASMIPATVGRETGLTSPVVPATQVGAATRPQEPFNMTWTCTNGFLQAEVSQSNFEGYVFIKGSTHQCNKTLPAGSGHPRTVRFGYDECGIQNWGRIIVALKNHPELATFQWASYALKCNRKFLTVFEGIEDGTSEQTFPPAYYEKRIAFTDETRGKGWAIIEVGPPTLYSGFVSNCTINVRGGSNPYRLHATDPNGCAWREDIVGNWVRDPATETLKAPFSLPPDVSIAIENYWYCDIKTCLGRCEDQCPSPSNWV